MNKYCPICGSVMQYEENPDDWPFDAIYRCQDSNCGFVEETEIQEPDE